MARGRRGSSNRKQGGKRAAAASPKEMEGRLEVTRGGFGFVLVEGQEQDIFVQQHRLGGAVAGDTVRLKIIRQRPRRGPEGAVTAVLKRGRGFLVGTLEAVPGGFELATLEPLAGRAIRVGGHLQGASPGDLVYARIKDWGDGDKPIQALVEEVIGRSDDPHTDYKLVLRQHELQEAFPSAVEAEVEALAGKVSIGPGGERRDLRSLEVITIDPASAKDFDDAISLEKLKGDRWQLGVHIADVSHYVRAGSLTDAEAFRRGNSVYFHEGVVPMLPHRLSSDLCSLRPREDRPALSVLITLSADGAVQDVAFTRSLIHSKQRFAYEEVHEILAAGKGKRHTLLSNLKRLTDAVYRRRVAQGSVDFDIPEPLFELDAHGVPHQIRPSERLDSHRLVEECMLLANRLVAERIPAGKPRIPFLYRVHDEPGAEKMTALSALLKRMNLPGLPRKEVTSAVVRDLLLAMEDSPYKDLIEILTLRSMAKAAYSPENVGHFGLAFPMYTHFTSPIRRYADLVVHRMMTDRLAAPHGPAPRKSRTLAKIGAQCTQLEIKAVKAERAYRRLKELRYLATQVGQRYEGIISGVTAKGLFVQLRELLIDGFVPIDRLEDDSYTFDDRLYALVGRKERRQFQLGQEITIRVDDVSVEGRRADFVLAEDI